MATRRYWSIRIAPQAIADGILKVLRSTHLRDDLRQRGLKRAQEYSWARSVQRVREVYGEVLS